jgi:hypothetical protein
VSGVHAGLTGGSRSVIVRLPLVEITAPTEITTSFSALLKSNSSSCKVVLTRHAPLW